MDDADTDQVEIVDVLYNVAFTSARTKLKATSRTPENIDKASVRKSSRKSNTPKTGKSSSKKNKSKNIDSSPENSALPGTKRKILENTPSSSKKQLKCKKALLKANDNVADDDGETERSVEMSDNSVYIVERVSDNIDDSEESVGLSPYITRQSNDIGHIKNSEKNHRHLNKHSSKSPKVKIHLAKRDGDTAKVVYKKQSDESMGEDVISPESQSAVEKDVSDGTASSITDSSTKQLRGQISLVSNSHKRRGKKSPKVTDVLKDGSEVVCDTANSIDADDKAAEAMMMSDDHFSECQQKPIIKHYLGPDAVLVLLEHPQQVVMKGKAMVSVLCGEAELLGYRLTSTQSPVPVFTPGTHSRIVLHTVSGCKRSSSSVLNKKNRDKLHHICNDKAVVSEVLSSLSDMSDSSVLILYKKMESKVWDYLTTFTKYYNALVHKDDGTDFEAVDIDVVSTLDSRAPAIDISESYRQAETVWSSCLQQKVPCRFLSCGGKNSGKSTLNRYLINTALNSVDKVLYLECDPGQTEFTPPGCISLSTITEPVLGPPFSHQREPLFVCFIGHVSVAECPRLYIKAVQKAYKTYLNLDDATTPLIINTMGWNKGLGLHINIDVIRVVQPSIIVQLNLQNEAQNFPHMLPEMVNHDSNGWSKKTALDLSGDCAYDVITVDSPVKSSPAFLSAPDHRHSSCLAYFTSCTDGLNTTSLLSAVPYKVPWSSVAVHVYQPGVPPAQIMYTLNASLVALCSYPIGQYARIGENEEWPRLCSELPICRCVGLGLVRGIDPDEKMLYIITPITQAELATVTLIVRGTVGLPDDLFMKQKGPNVPYLGKRQLTVGAEALRQRKYMKRRHSGRTWVPHGK